MEQGESGKSTIVKVSSYDLDELLPALILASLLEANATHVSRRRVSSVLQLLINKYAVIVTLMPTTSVRHTKKLHSVIRYRVVRLSFVDSHFSTSPFLPILSVRPTTSPTSPPKTQETTATSTPRSARRSRRCGMTRARSGWSSKPTCSSSTIQLNSTSCSPFVHMTCFGT